MEDNLETKVAKLVKYGNEKFGLQETTLRGVLDNASGNESMPSELVLGEWNGVLSAEGITANIVLILNEDETASLTAKEGNEIVMSITSPFFIEGLEVVLDNGENVFAFTYQPKTNTLLADEMLSNMSLNRPETENLPNWYLNGTWYPTEEILFLGDLTVSFVFESGNSFKWIILIDDDGLGNPVDPYESALSGSYNIVGNEILINLDTFSELGAMNAFKLDSTTGLLYFVLYENDNNILVTKTKEDSTIVGGEYNLESVILENGNQKMIATKVTQPPNVIFTQQEDGSYHLEIVKAEE